MSVNSGRKHIAAILTFPNACVDLAEDGLQQRRKQCIAYLRNNFLQLVNSHPTNKTVCLTNSYAFRTPKTQQQPSLAQPQARPRQCQFDEVWS